MLRYRFENMNKFRVGFYVFLTFLCLFLLWRFIDFRAVWSSVYGVNWLILGVALALGFGFGVLQSLRLQVLLNLVSRVSFFSLLSMVYVSGLFSIVLPYSGGFAMAYSVAQKTKIPYKKIFRIFFFEFVLAQIPLLVLGGIGLIYFAQRKVLVFDLFHLFGWLAILLFVFLFILLGLFFIKRNFFLRLIYRVKEGLGIVWEFRPVFLSVLFLTLLMAVVANIQTYLYFLAFHIYPPFWELILAMNVFGILRFLPGLPTRLGQDETIGVLTLPYLLGLDKNAVFALLFVTHIFSLLMGVGLGLVFLYFLKVDLQFFRAARR